ncbi:MAG: 2-oxoacid:acceptor oxidoreductase subunit alpha [Elusimicrobiota bacterium]|jgi:2-oxoglutarate ferredoxin oxidoreductase subunit alpha
MMKEKTISVWVGGAAGDGIASVGESLAKIFARNGLQVYAYNSYQSVIRGGHVWWQMTAGAEKVYTQSETCHLLIALNQESIDRHADRVDKSGGILFNSDRLQVRAEHLRNGAQSFGLPVAKLAKLPIVQNTVATGAFVYLTDLPLESYEKALRERFAKKKADVVQANIDAARAGYAYAKENWKSLGLGLELSNQQRLVMTGNQAIAVGALAANCRFYSAYPMTPASSIMHFLASHGPANGLCFKQCEDEIAAINMAIGASQTGARAMTGTSGGGFSLMTEAVGLAGMLETPVVIANVQRGGPSTGLPTKTEQGDLFQVLGASQGEYPRIILAPHTIPDAFRVTTEAFNLADKYQCPVLLISDLLLSEHTETVESLDLKIRFDRGETLTEWKGDGYLRYRDTPSGISPRVLPGTPGVLYVSASDEHNEKGDVISDVFTDPLTRKKMVEKRMRKMVLAKQELAKLFPVALEGPAAADVTLVGWGSTYNVIQALIRRLEEDGIKANVLMIKVVAPFLSEGVTSVLSKCKRLVMIENNFSSQMARLIRMETGIHITDRILKYDGEPFLLSDVYEPLKKILGKSNG